MLPLDRRTVPNVLHAFGTIVILAVMAILILSCGASTSTPQAAATPGTAPQATQQSTTAAKTQGGTLTIAYDEEEQSLDFAKATSTSGRVAYSMNMGDGLFFLDAKGTVTPWLAESFEQPAPTVYVFKIRQGVKFQDGTTLDAAAVKFSLDRLVDPKLGAGRGNLFPIASTEVVDSNTLRVTLKAPFAPFVRQLTDPTSYIVSPTAVQKEGDAQFGRQPVGTGPFKFVEWVSGDHVTMDAFDGYWRGRPSIDRIVWRLIKDPDARAAQLRAGDAQMGVSLPEAQLSVFQNDPNLTTDKRGSVRWFGVGMNITCKPLDNVLVRQAVEYAVDNNSIVNKVLLGVGEATNQPLIQGVFGYDANLKTRYDYNPQKAKDLLTQAGFPNGFDTTFVYTPGYNPGAMEAIQSQLAAVGIRAKLNMMDAAAYTDLRNKGQHCLAADSWGAIYYDADFGLYSKFHSSSIVPKGFNLYFLNDPKVDQPLAAGRSELDATKRAQDYADAIEQIQSDAVFVPISRFVFVNARSKKLNGLVQNASDQWWLAEAWLSK